MIRLGIACLLICLLSSFAQAQTPSQSQILQLRHTIGMQLAQQPNNRAVRYRYAQASFQAGDNAAAKYHLTHLMRSSKNEQELAQLKKAYGLVLEKSALSFSGSLSFLPSTNIKKTSSNTSFNTLFHRFDITDGGNEKSGVGLRFGGALSYQTAFSNGTFLTYGLAVHKNLYPVKSLNRLDGIFSLTLSQYMTGSLTQLQPYIMKFSYDAKGDDNADSMRYGYLFRHEYFLAPSRSLTGSFTVEYRDYKTLNYLDGPFVATSLTYKGLAATTLPIQIRVGVSKSSPPEKRLRYTAVSVAGQVVWPLKNIGSIGFDLSYDARRYHGDFTGLDYRRADKTAKVGVSYRPTRLRILNTIPRLACGYTQNWSNVALYDYRSTDCSITFERSF